jgi:branched-chain amino acid transport system substrate-binding protein
VGLAILLVLGGVGGFLFWLFNRPDECKGGQILVKDKCECPAGQSFVNGTCQAITPPPPPPEVIDKISGLNPFTTNSVNTSTPAKPWQLQRFFKYRPNPDADQGVDLFNQQKFLEAFDAFEKAASGDPKDPEVLIYKNNALAQTKASATTPLFRMAVIVPADKNADVAMEILRGVAQAQERFNKSNGLNGRYLELILAIDGNDPQTARQLAQVLSAVPDLLGVVGHNISNVTQAVLPIYEAAGLAIVSPTSTSTQLKSRTFFRTVPSDEAMGTKLVDYLVSQKVQRVALVYDDDTYSQSLLSVVENGLNEAQIQVKGRLDLTSSSSDPSQDLADLNSAPDSDRPEVIVLMPGQKNRSLINQLLKVNAQAKRRFQFVGSDTLYNSDTLAIGAEVVKGLILAVPWARDSATAASFSERVRLQWKGDVGWRVATSYDAMQALIKSLSAQADRASVLAALQQLNLTPENTSGEPLTFTNGDRNGAALLVEATNRTSCGQVAGTGMAFCLLPEERSASPQSSKSPKP